MIWDKAQDKCFVMVTCCINYLFFSSTPFETGKWDTQSLHNLSNESSLVGTGSLVLLQGSVEGWVKESHFFSITKWEISPGLMLSLGRIVLNCFGVSKCCEWHKNILFKDLWDRGWKSLLWTDPRMKGDEHVDLCYMLAIGEYIL